MKNMLYYLKKYGNLSFQAHPFNEIDALILSQISYLNVDLFTHDYNEEVFVKDILTPENAKKLAFASMTRAGNEKLAKIFPKTTRYDKVYFKHVENKINYENVEQFFAMTFFVEKLIFIAYRGTDLTIAGWQEDFNMAFSETVPAQTDSVIYLNKIYDLYHRDVLIGGHSKGGNLALYAYLNTSDDIRNHVSCCYDFDGPGFIDKSLLESENYLKGKDKIKAMSSTMSVVAMLMYNVDNIIFLKTSGFTVLQHNPYNWHIQSKRRLKRIKRNSITSRYFTKGVDRFFTELDPQDIKKFFKTLYFIAMNDPKSSLLDIKAHPFRFIRNVHQRRKLLTLEQAKHYSMMKKKIKKVFTDVLKEEIERKLNEGHKRKIFKVFFRFNK